MMNKVFIDSSFFKAFIDEKDDFHKKSCEILKILEKEKSYLVTSNYILDETITLIRVRCGIERVRDLREALVKLSFFKIIRATSLDEEKAWDWFWNDWSKLSYTDCVSFAVMKRLEIEKVATFDEHFGKAGYKMVK